MMSLTLPGTSRSASPLLIGESSSVSVDRPIIARPGHFQAGVSMASNLPLKRPFRSQDGSTYQNFQFQTSQAIGLEFAMGWSKHLSFAVQGGWEHLATRLDTGSGNNTEFQTASVSIIPVMLAAKYHFRKEHWTPELELAVGMGLYRFEFSSSNNSATTDRASTASLLGHALVGARFHWNDQWSLAFHFGYRMTAVGKQTLDNNIREAESQNFAGILSRGGISYVF